MKFLATMEKVYSREIEAESKEEAHEIADEIVWTEGDVVGQTITVEE